MDHSNKLTHLSLCTGYGGIDLGLKRALDNVRTVAYVEIEAFQCANLVSKMEKGWLDAAPLWTNVKTFPWANFRGKVDILSGGFPCQPFSTAGKKESDEDPRHLWPHIKRGIEIIRPALIFMENVEGIISSKLQSDQWSDPKNTSVLLHVLRELERLGYKATAGVFSASEIGAPHQRKRVFIMAQLTCLDQSCFEWKKLMRSFFPSGRGQEPHEFEPSRITVDYPDGRRLETQWSEFTMHKRKTRKKETNITIWRGSTRLKKLVNTYLVKRKISRPKRTSNNSQNYRTQKTQATRSTNVKPRKLRRKIKSPVGRLHDGASCRLDKSKLYTASENPTDEFRSLGNGVVPDTAARAFTVLYAELAHA